MIFSSENCRISIRRGIETFFFEKLTEFPYEEVLRFFHPKFDKNFHTGNIEIFQLFLSKKRRIFK